MECTHPPSRLYAWRAYDETLVVTCCECGSVLQGAYEDAQCEHDGERYTQTHGGVSYFYCHACGQQTGAMPVGEVR
jgi:hypothetical protein